MTIIDFDLAVRGMDTLDGFTGTDGWTAPEVGKAQRYNPMLADIWSAGKVISSLCWLYVGSEDREFLLDLSKTMMATHPNKRPSMKSVVDSVDRYAETSASNKRGSTRDAAVYADVQT